MVVGCAAGGDRRGRLDGSVSSDAGPLPDARAVDAPVADAGTVDAAPAVDAGPMFDPSRFCVTDEGCNDGVCNGEDYCHPEREVCAWYAPPTCDDGQECTDDSCAEPDGCIYTPFDSRCPVGQVCVPHEGCMPPPPCRDDTECDDGDACNGVETCDVSTGCRAGTPLECEDDGVACTAESCRDGACVSTPMDGLCDPGLSCIPGDGCRACVRDEDCDDGNACNGAETCGELGCEGGVDVECADDGVACTVETCTEPAGAGVSTPMDSLCAGGLSCVAGRGCAACTDDAECDDGVACNGVETCGAAGCVGGTPVTCGDGIACTVDACVEPAGTCSFTPDDGMCAADESCVPGVGCSACSAMGCAGGGGDGEECGSAIVVGRTAAMGGAVFDGDTTGDGDDEDVSSSLGSDCWDAKYDNFYRVYLVAGDRLDVALDVMESDFDAMLKLYSGTNCAGGGTDDLLSCTNDGFDGRDESFSYTAAADGWYTIVVDGRLAFNDDYDWGRYRLTVTLACSDAGCCCS